MFPLCGPVGFIVRESALCNQRCLCNANQGTRSGENQGICFKSTLSTKPRCYNRHSHIHTALPGKQVSNEQVRNQQRVCITSSQSSPLYKRWLPSLQVAVSVTSSSDTLALKGLNPSEGRGGASSKRLHVKGCFQAFRSTLCWRSCPHHPGGLQTSPADRDNPSLSQGALFPHSFTSSPPKRDYFTFYLLLMHFASTIQTNFSAGRNTFSSSTSRAHRV